MSCQPFNIVLCCILLFSAHALSAETITVHPLTAPITVDGVGSDWGNIANTTLLLHPTYPDIKTQVDSVLIKAGIWEDRFYLYASWADPTESLLHKPYVWDAVKQRYVQGDAREDRFAIQFEISGDYTPNWLSGNEFIADMWHWKSSRTNPVGIANDKMTQISQQKLLRASKLTAETGQTLYLLRSWDAGERNYSTKRYGKQQAAVMPKYILLPDITRDTVDIHAKGIWQAGRWSLELSRQLNTGNDDDVVFIKGQAVKAGIGIFESTDNHDHAISDLLIFQF